MRDAAIAPLIVLSALGSAAQAATLVDKRFDAGAQVDGSWTTDGGVDDVTLPASAALTDLTLGLLLEFGRGADRRSFRIGRL